MATIDLSTLINTSTGRLGSAMEKVGALDPNASPAEFSKALLEAQLQMGIAQSAVTGASEVIKAMGEGQKGISKNMAI
jgi:hypothetical protein